MNLNSKTYYVRKKKFTHEVMNNVLLKKEKKMLNNQQVSENNNYQLSEYQLAIHSNKIFIMFHHQTKSNSNLHLSNACIGEIYSNISFLPYFTNRFKYTDAQS